MRHRYSPAVRTLAAQHGIDLTRVPGTGHRRQDHPQGCAGLFGKGAAGAEPVAGDSGAAKASAAAAGKPLQRHARGALRHCVQVKEAPPMPKIEVEPPEAGEREYFIDVTPIRKTIATRMRQSVSEIPHAWTSIEVDVTNLVALRNKVKDEFKRNEGVNLTYMAFLIKAVVSAIKDYPIMNSVWSRGQNHRQTGHQHLAGGRHGRFRAHPGHQQRRSEKYRRHRPGSRRPGPPDKGRQS